MTAPVAPMEARCAHCHDTGSLSKQIDGSLDCHYCDATEKRIAMRNHLAQFTGWPENDVTAWAAYLFAQRQAAPVAAQPSTPKLPSTPEDVVAFIGDHFDAKWPCKALQDARYKLSVHNLLSCFQNLADFAGEVAQPADPDDMAANYDHSTHDKRMEVLKGLRAEQPGEVAGQVPVAWMYQPIAGNGSQWCVTLDARFAEGFGMPLTPLYAAPQPAAQPSDDVSDQFRGEGWIRAMADISAMLPGPYYMDPPDGGSVTVLEQVERMAADATRMRWMAERGAFISYSMDGEVCSVWLPAKRGGDEDDRPAEGWPQKCYNSWQLAIDAAMAKEKA